MYDSLQKAIRDHEWAMKHAINQGIEEGRMEGIQIGEERGKVQMLNLPPADAAQLNGMSLVDLRKLVLTLQTQIRSRTQTS